jgi:hypothetical protein
MSQSIVGTHGNAVSAENATGLRKLFGKSILAESKNPGRAHRHAYAVSTNGISLVTFWPDGRMALEAVYTVEFYEFSSL